jgi:hypothetical protein
MFYGQCNKCGERWELGTASTCKCPDLVTWDASAPLVVTPHPAFKQPWVGLANEEIEAVMHGSVEGERMLPYQFARAIETKLKEKNEAP